MAEQDYPTTLVDDNEEELDHLNRTQERGLETLQEEWKVKNRVCYEAIMDVCLKNGQTMQIKCGKNLG